MLTEQAKNQLIVTTALLCVYYIHEIQEINRYVVEDNRWYEDEAKMKFDDFKAVTFSNGSVSVSTLSKTADEHFINLLSWIEQKKHYRRELAMQVRENNNRQQSLDTIVNSNFIQTLEHLENKIANKISKWKTKARGSQIECAAFCEMLWENGFFMSKINRIKTCTEYAKAKYGIDIDIQMRKTKEKDRLLYKMKLKHFFL